MVQHRRPRQAPLERAFKLLIACDGSTMTQDRKTPWPRDLKIFALVSAAWAAGLTVRILMRDASYYAPDTPLQAVIGGMKFFGPTARVVLLVQATIFAAFAIGIVAERKWGLVLALFYMTEVVMSHLIFMLAYMGDMTESASLRVAGAEGAGAVLVLLYLWIRSRDLLFDRRT